jgi:Protein of unknown function (DUF1573)
MLNTRLFPLCAATIVAISCAHLFAADTSPEIKTGFLEFEQPHLDLVLELGEKRVGGAFAFTNKGANPIKIVGIKTSCGCTVADIDKKLYAPGEKGSIKVSYNGTSSQSEDSLRHVVVVTDEETNNFYSLEVQPKIKRIIKMSPTSVGWGIGAEAAEKSITLDAVDSLGVHITEVESSNDTFEVTLKTIKPNKQYEIVVKPSTTSLAATGSLRIKTTNEKIPTLFSKVYVR